MGYISVGNKSIESAFVGSSEVSAMYYGNTEVYGSYPIEDTTPYIFRQTADGKPVGNKCKDTIVGGTIAWNQLVDESTKTISTATATLNNGIWTFSGTTTAARSAIFVPDINIANHIIYIIQDSDIPGTQWVARDMTNATNIKISSRGYAFGSAIIQVPSSCDTFRFYGNVANSTIFNGETSYIQAYDLTQMFGIDIAQYVYNLEVANTEGVAWFKKLFPKDYYSYNSSALLSVNTSAHITTGFNQYDYSTGQAVLLGQRQYQITGTYTSVSYIDISGNSEILTVDASGYFTPANNGILTVIGGNSSDTCVHLVRNGERDGQYEPCIKHEYPLDISLELRGIPKLDASNELYYDGDLYESDGTVTHRYGIVDLGSLIWSDGGIFNTARLTNVKIPSSTNVVANIISTNYVAKARSAADNTGDIAINTDGKVYVRITGSTPSGYLVYELATSSEETATPFTNPQVVNGWGTEQYVDYAESQGTRDVAIPVGHTTFYKGQ